MRLIVLLLTVCAVAHIEAENCRRTEKGLEYTGTKFGTRRGTASNGKSVFCQRWTSQSPHRHSFNKDHMFPDKSVKAAANYCRNPDNAPGGPWCYTLSSSVRWAYCDVPFCVKNCKYTRKGWEYMGKKAHTRSGKKCQHWTQQSPHRHGMTSAHQFPDASVSDAKNYCRNPDRADGGPWCYTEDPHQRWDWCLIRMC